MSEHHGAHVGYYRVSTSRQGVSGLGLDAQRKAVEDYLNGGNWTLDREFTEIESGRKANRNPVLNEALKYCRDHGATLVIAKLDRLARNVAFVSRLMESGVEFIAVDNPHATRFTIHILAAVSELEREQISKRTKDALAAAKERGVVLGSPTIAQHMKDRAQEHAEPYRVLLAGMMRKGYPHRKMVAMLNSQNHHTPRGKTWSLTQLQRTLKRLGL